MIPGQGTHPGCVGSVPSRSVYKKATNVSHISVLSLSPSHPLSLSPKAIKKKCSQVRIEKEKEDKLGSESRLQIKDKMKSSLVKTNEVISNYIQ